MGDWHGRRVRLITEVRRCRYAQGPPLLTVAFGDAPEDRSADPSRRPSRVPARVGMPCVSRAEQCDRDPAFEQRQRPARPRGFGWARGILESAPPRGEGCRGFALALAATRAQWTSYRRPLACIVSFCGGERRV